ncbi:BMP family protein [Zhaonella formicivorans]|uniref:BMP family protein n=1 Tax=Zhaonella formicivorans TaxID=2528593 RepID=UPI0010EFAB0B|nr:BMP family protein [Zhaonella formicivorans]
MFQRKKWTIALVLVLALAVLAGCGGQKADNSGTEQPQGDSKETLKVGILLPGNINDKGWNASAYEGLMQAKEKFGVEVTYQENVTQSDMEEVFRNYATNGYNLIIGHGYQFSDAAQKVAEEFPDAKFAILNGYVSNGKNLASYSFTNWQPGYVAGTLAGLLTKTNKIGAIGAQKIPVIEDALEAFKDAAKAVNPNAEVVITYVDSWDDVAKGKETALAMINNGADVVTCDANAVGLGAIEAAKEKGTYHIGFVDDQYNVAPEVVVASAIQSNQEMVKYVVKAVLDGNFKPEQNVLGIKEGVEGISSFHDWESKLPKEVIDKVMQVNQDIIDGKITWTKK